MKLDWWIQIIFSFTYLISSIILSVWLEINIFFLFVISAFFIIAGLKSYKKVIGLPIFLKKNIWSWLITLFLFMLIIRFSNNVISAFKGYSPYEPTIQLSFPLKNGIYYLSSGGSTEIINYHNSYAPERYAHDIFKFNKFGFRAKGIYPSKLDKYEIFGDTLFCPCSGLVITAVDSFEDKSPPKVGKLFEGNEVNIKSKDVVINMSHLKQGSLMVAEGDTVKIGQPIACVGNSGRSSEPHLHIQAQKNNVGIPMEFDGRFLVRNSLVFR